MRTPTGTPPAFLRLAGHPLRWRVLTELATGDLRVRELVALVDEPQSLVSYHLRLLRDAGLVTSRRSAFDARDSYYHLDPDRCAAALAEVGPALHPWLRSGPPPVGEALEARPSVLFVCTGNSARSPVAEALVRHHTAGRVRSASAGTRPRPRLHPLATQALRERCGVDISDQRPRHLDTVSGERFDYLVTLCDKAREALPPGGLAARRIHWSVLDPASGADGAPVRDLQSFADVVAELNTRVRHLLPVLDHTSEETA
jgi:protein-tyrosine-phosphatase/DNA-binding transcriptional ArsR family regulator